MKLGRFALIGALVAALAACSSDTDSPSVAKTLAAGLKAKASGETPPPSPTADQIRASITPELRAANANAPLMIASSLRVPVSSIMAMSGQNGDVRTYLAPDGISFSLRSGVLIASRGLGTDLMAADVSQVLPRIRAGSGQAARVHRYLNGEDTLVSQSYNCTYARAGGEVVERCSGEDVTFENRYVLGRNGAITVSVQWVGPGLGSFRLEDLG